MNLMLTSSELAEILEVTSETIRMRESGRSTVRREAELALQHLIMLTLPAEEAAQVKAACQNLLAAEN
jgi:DNA-binding XRE family transcriptional regulator